MIDNLIALRPSLKGCSHGCSRSNAMTATGAASWRSASSWMPWRVRACPRRQLRSRGSFRSSTRTTTTGSPSRFALAPSLTLYWSVERSCAQEVPLVHLAEFAVPHICINGQTDIQYFIRLWCVGIHQMESGRRFCIEFSAKVSA